MFNSQLGPRATTSQDQHVPEIPRTSRDIPGSPMNLEGATTSQIIHVPKLHVHRTSRDILGSPMNLEGATKSHVLFVPQVPRTSRDIPGIYMNLEALRNGMGEVNDETKHLSSDVQRSKRVLRPRNSRGRCVPPKKRIRLFESSGEDEPGSQSNIQQSGGTGVNKGLSVTDTSIGMSEFSNDDGSEMMQKTSPTDKVRDESEPPSGDVRTVKHVLQPRSARGRCASRKQLHIEDAGSSSEDEPETHVHGKRGGGGASVRGRGNRSTANRSGRGGKRSGSTDGKGSSGTSGRKRTGSARLPSEAIDINIKDSQFHEPDEFCPLREPGPYVPNGGAISALSLFELFFDAMVIARIISSTLSHAEAMKRNFGKVQLMAFIGALILLGIHNVRNHRKAWSTNKAQVLYRLRDLLKSIF